MTKKMIKNLMLVLTMVVLCFVVSVTASAGLADDIKCAAGSHSTPREEVVTAATCGTVIVRVYCSNCNKLLETKAIPATGAHTPVNVPAVDATCLKEGYTAGTKCSVCEEVLSGCEVVKALGHTDVDVDSFCDVCTLKIIIATGICGAEGDNVIWTLYGDGELVISGEGEMEDYFDDYGGRSTDWYEYDIYKVTVENGVTHIGSGSFYSFFGHENKIKTIDIADSVKSIGQQAFYNCQFLSEISIPNYVTEIERQTFYGCENIKKLILPDNLISIGDSAFEYCKSLATVTIPDSVMYIGERAFSFCRNLSQVTIPDGITTIRNSTFVGCLNLTQVTMPDSVINIGDRAFEGCYSLTCMVIPDSVITIGAEAFCNCTSLTNINIPKSVEKIGEHVFWGCYNLIEIIVDVENNNYCSDYFGVLFNKDKTILIQYSLGSNRRSYTVPDSVITIGESAFLGATSLESIILPADLSVVEDFAFAMCVSLENVTIPKKLTKLGVGAFSYLPFLEKIIVETIDADFGGYACANVFSVSGISKEKFVELFKDALTTNMETVFDVLQEYITIHPVEAVVYTGTIYCHSGSTAETYAIENGVNYVLTHFYEDEWTYDYDNMIRYRKCIHCDELETEQLETTENEDDALPKENFFSKLFAWIEMLIDLILSIFK